MTNTNPTAGGPLVMTATGGTPRGIPAAGGGGAIGGASLVSGGGAQAGLAGGGAAGAFSQQGTPSQWHPQTSGFRPAQWQPGGGPSGPRPGFGGFGGQPMGGGRPSVASQALSNANPQALQSYLTALGRGGAGGSNAQMTSSPSTPQPPRPLIGPPPGFNNGTPGHASYVGGFNPGMAQVDYAFGPPSGNLLQNWQAPKPNTNLIGQPGMGTPGGIQFGQQGYGNQTIPMPGGAQQIPQPGTLTMSDRRAKSAVRPGKSALRAWLDDMGVHEYSYKDERDGVGRFISPMAQELEKSAVGRQAVVETPRGKMVDHARLSGPLLSAAADLHQRVSALEKGSHG